MKMKNVLVTMVAVVMAVLLCVGFGFCLSEREQASERLFYSDLSDGYKISALSSANRLENDQGTGSATAATLELDKEWMAEKNYLAMLRLPDEVFTHGAECTATVYYPKSLKAGETGTVAVFVISDSGDSYCGFCQFEAVDDLQIVYGSDDSLVASGGEGSYDGNKLSLWFYTGATSEHYTHRDGVVDWSSYQGDLEVQFIGIDQSDSSADPSELDRLEPAIPEPQADDREYPATPSDALEDDHGEDDPVGPSQVIEDHDKVEGPVPF